MTVEKPTDHKARRAMKFFSRPRWYRTHIILLAESMVAGLLTYPLIIDSNSDCTDSDLPTGPIKQLTMLTPTAR